MPGHLQPPSAPHIPTALESAIATAYTAAAHVAEREAEATRAASLPALIDQQQRERIERLRRRQAEHEAAAAQARDVLARARVAHREWQAQVIAAIATLEALYQRVPAIQQDIHAAAQRVGAVTGQRFPFIWEQLGGRHPDLYLLDRAGELPPAWREWHIRALNQVRALNYLMYRTPIED